MIIYTNNKLNSKIGKISAFDDFDKDFYYHYLFIVSHIRTYPFIDRRFDKDDFIPIQMKVLKKLVSYNYAHIFLNNLVEHGVLKTDNYYVKGLKAKGYKICDEYLDDKFFVVECKDEKLKQKVGQRYKEMKNKVFEESFGYGYVTNCMEELKVSYRGCIEFIEGNSGEVKDVDSYMMMTDLFSEKFAKVDDKGKRLHNNLTNFATPLRKFLSYRGENIIQVDIRNSQPLFLYLLMKDFFIREEEMNKYKDVVTNIGFYEFFSEKLKFKLNKENRKDFKQKIFSGVLFDRNRSKLTKYEDVFKKEFPSIFHVIRNMKSVEYEKVSINLQKTESKFIFYCVEKIAQEKKIPMFTIHDSICTTEGNEELVKKIILEEFYKLYTISPKLNVEKFA